MEIKEVNVYSREELSALPKEAVDRVLILDFDDTLAAFDLANMADEDGAQNPRYLIGGDETKQKLYDLYCQGIKLCIATNKNKDGAIEAKAFLAKENIKHLFDLIVYEKTADKAALLATCKSHYNNDQNTTQFVLIDDNEQCRASATRIGITAIDPLTQSNSTPGANGLLLSTALDHAKEGLTTLQDQRQDELDTVTKGNSSTTNSNETKSQQNPRQLFSAAIFTPLNPLAWLISANTSLAGAISIHRDAKNFKQGTPLSDKLLTACKWYFPNLMTIMKTRFVKAIGFDGYNPITNLITSADGETVEYTGSSIPFWLMLASFLGLPSRPETVVNGVPQFSGWQLLRNLFGVWNPVKETLSNENGTLSFHQKRWTEKKIVQMVALLVKILVIFPLKLALIPFKLMLNLVKLITEMLIPTFSGTILALSLLTGGYTLKLASIAKEKGWLSGLVLSIPILILGALTAALTVIQYGTMLAVRAGLALTSPYLSARLAFSLGYRLTIGKPDSLLQKSISSIMGVLGVAVSLTLTAVLWTITLPLALGALTTAIPSLLSAITWVSQSSVVASTLSWVSQFPLIINSMNLLSGLFGTIGTALTAAFGSTIATLASLIHVQIPLMVITVGTTLGLLAVPTAALLSRVADAFSTLWVTWVEQRPFAGLAARSKRNDKTSTDYVELKDSPSQDEPSEKKADNFEVYVYQPEAGKEYIVSTELLYLTRQNNALLEHIHVREVKAERLYQRALSNDENIPGTNARFPTEAEKAGKLEVPALVSC